MFSPFASSPAWLPVANISLDSELPLSQDIAYQGVGVLIVLGALMFLAVSLTFMARILGMAGLIPRPKESRAETAAKGAPLPAGDSSQNIPDSVRIAIAAAVHVTLGSGLQIVDIRPARNPQMAVWSMEGRRQIFQSHRLR